MIVGQDTGTLRRALASVAQIADEIILEATADDSDVENIATSFGVRVFNRPWADDFSAARNEAFARATQDWIFWLDADERLDARSLYEIKACLVKAETLAWLVNIVDCSGPKDSPRFSSTPLPRLFRRIPELRLAGRVHEHFEPNLNVTAHRLGLDVRSSTINIFHDGYSLDREAEKLRRNIRLMELELHDRSGQLFYQIRLSQGLLKMGDPRAFHFLRQAWQQVRLFSALDRPPPEPLVAELLDSVLVRQIRGEFDSGESVEQLMERAANWYPFWPPLIWRRAKWKFNNGRMEEAVDALEHILQLAAAGSYQHTPSFDAAILAGETCLNLGICYARLQRFEIAERYFSLAARDPARKSAAEHNLTLLAAARRF